MTDLVLANSGPNLEGTGKGDTEDGTHFNESGNLVVRDALLAAMAEVFGVEDVAYRDVYPVTAVPMAGTGGAVMAPKISVTLGIGVEVIVLAFAVVAIGGMGSIEGALIGALIVGMCVV